MRGFKRSRALWDEARQASTIRSYVRAILYELQPVRMSNIDVASFWTAGQRLARVALQFVTMTLPSMVRQSGNFVISMSPMQWLLVLAVVAYYYFIRWVHHTLHAGPITLMVTALAGIFTIGLGNTSGDGSFSAYSVFNRGFERLLGSVDANALLAQHVGMMGPLAMGNHDERQDIVAEVAAPRHRRQENGENELNIEQQPEEEAPRDANNENNADRARRSGKKARRRNQEQRREMRQQREAALAMGFGGNEDQDRIAMQRLIEEQVANAPVNEG